MKQRKLGKRIAAGLICLVLVLTSINLPAFTTAVKAEEAPTITFTFVAGEPTGFSTKENPDKALDGNTSTKWCAKFSNTAYIILQASDAVLPTGYSITTGNDTASYTGRNPKKWTLYASNNYDSKTKTGDWTVIDAIEDGNLPAKNLEKVDFEISDCQDVYEYYKWVIEQISAEDIIQVSEFALSYSICEHSYKKTGEIIESTCVEKGYDIEECSFCHARRNVENNQPLKAHDMEDGICSVCGYSIKPPITVYATKAELVDPDNFTLHKDNGNGIAQKVNFGDGKTWYIAGGEHNCDDITCTDTTPNELVFICDSENAVGYKMFSDSRDIRTYDGESDWGTYETPLIYDPEGGNSSQVYSNHYGASDIRAFLNKDVLNAFTATEQSLMKNNKFNIKDNNNDKIYSISDKLYLANGTMYAKYFTVGVSEIKIGLPGYGTNGSPFSEKRENFWLRAPSPYYNDSAMLVYATYERDVQDYYTDKGLYVIPAFNMDLEQVLFASIASCSESEATLSNAMNLRMDGKDIVKSSALACKDRVVITKGASDKEYLYIQGRDGEIDWVYSKKITADETVLMEDIQTYKSLSEADLAKCRIWIETTVDNVTYAKEIKAKEKHNFATCKSVDENKHEGSCSNCGFVIREGHDFTIYESVDNKNHKGTCVDCGYVIQGKHEFSENAEIINLGNNKYGQECSICHEVIEMENHDFAGQPCTPADKKGKHKQTCKDCSEVLISDCTPGVAVEENKTDATCTVDGSYELVTYCTECEQELKREPQVIKATGEHEFGTYVSDENATCTEDGTKTAICLNCGEKDVQEDTGSKLGHDYSNHKYVDSKYHTEVCSRCEAINNNQELHDFSDYVSDENATCTQNGTKTATCPTCGGKDEQEEPDTKLGHDYTIYKYVNGIYHKAECSRCGVSNLEPHDFSEDATKCKLCKTSIATEKELSKTFYISKTDFEKKDFNDTYNLDNGTCVKVNFGSHTESGDGKGEKTSQVWYIAGRNTDDGTLVLFCDPTMPMKKDQLFNNFGSATYYNGYEVYPNHYGASIIRAYLTGDALNNFSTAEKALMADTSFYTYDMKNGTNYRLSDKLYLFDTYGGIGNNTINSDGDVVGGFGIGLKRGIQAPGRKFWSRCPNYFENYEHIVVDGTNQLPEFVVNGYIDVVPACHLDLSSVLFASAATEAKVDTTFSDVMTFRMDGTEKVKSDAVFDKDGIKVTKKADDEYIYIQYKTGNEDRVWSKKIESDMNIFRACIGVDSFANCKIWIEKKDDTENLTYAVMAKSGSTNISNHAYEQIYEYYNLDTNRNQHRCMICYVTENHRFSDDTCQGTCTACGARNENGTHQFKYECLNRNEHIIRCLDCGKLDYSDKKAHEFVDGICTGCGVSDAVKNWNYRFASKEDLAMLSLSDSDSDRKVAFGSNGTSAQTWYIVGKNADGTLVLMCDPLNPMKVEQEFNPDLNVRIYNGIEVCPNHYGASELRAYLTGEALENFTDLEKEFMADASVYTGNMLGENIYLIKDKLYAGYGGMKSAFITVGNNTSGTLNGSLQIDLLSGKYSKGESFWLRTPNPSRTCAQLANPGRGVYGDMYGGSKDVDTSEAAVPAFHMDLSSVLFVSAAAPSTSDATLGKIIDDKYINNPLTFRMDGTDRVKSSAVACTGNIYVTKGSADNEYLYVQGIDNGTDWVYSKQITANEVVSAEDIKAAKALLDIDLTECKIWVETTVDNVTFAKLAVVSENHNFAEAGNAEKCSVCEIKNINFTGLDSAVAGETHIFTGSPITSDVTMTGLEKDVDYTVENVTETEVGVYAVKITGIGNYAGERTVYWNVYSANGLYCVAIPDQEYTGKPIKPVMDVYCDGIKLIPGKDYTLKYGKYNTNVATKDEVKNGKSVAPSVTIMGKGNYSDKKEITFSICPRTIETVMVDDITVAKGKSAIKVNPVVALNGKKLKLGTDYVISTTTDETGAVTSYAEAGVYDLYVVGKNNYTGYVPFTFTVTEKTLASKVSIAKIADQKYNDGNAIKPEVKITYNKKDVTDSFDVTYKNNTEIGTATVIIIAKAESEFAGSKTATFKIAGEQIKNAKLGADGKGKIPTAVYNGSAHEPDLDLYDGATPLTKNVDYTVTFDKNVNVGTATATVIGIGKYTGSKKFTFKIDKYDAGIDAANCIKVNGASADLADISIAYEKGGVTPKPEIKMGEIVLKEKTDYTLSYANNKAVAAKNATNASGKSVAPAMTITFKGNYSGKKTVNFAITKKPLGDLTIIVDDKPHSTKPNAWKQTKVTIIDKNGKKLVAGVDYDKNFKYYRDCDSEYEITGETTLNEDALNPYKQVFVHVDGINNYADSAAFGIYRISNENLAKVSASIEPQEYTGSAIEPSAEDIKVWVGSGAGKKELVAGVDYEIVEDSYKNNTNKGTATVTIIGKGNYYGTKVVKYTIGTKKFLWWEM